MKDMFLRSNVAQKKCVIHPKIKAKNVEKLYITKMFDLQETPECNIPKEGETVSP